MDPIQAAREEARNAVARRTARHPAVIAQTGTRKRKNTAANKIGRTWRRQSADKRNLTTALALHRRTNQPNQTPMPNDLVNEIISYNNPPAPHTTLQGGRTRRQRLGGRRTRRQRLGGRRTRYAGRRTRYTARRTRIGGRRHTRRTRSGGFLFKRRRPEVIKSIEMTPPKSSAIHALHEESEELPTLKSRKARDPVEARKLADERARSLHILKTADDSTIHRLEPQRRREPLEPK